MSLLLRRAASSCLPLRTSARQYMFASPQFVAAFSVPRPPLDTAKLREECVKYKFPGFHGPVSSVLRGKELEGGKTINTVSAFNEVNGTQRISTEAEVDAIIAHMKAFKPSRKDYRSVMRAVEDILLRDHAVELVVNQAEDFGKQDGITEIEESVQANAVERALNDSLFSDECKGVVSIRRHPALVGCVSNFSNFLDLCRKVLRNLEVGVPVVVLSRSNTTQHTYRWFQLLQSVLLQQRDFDRSDIGMLTYASCDIAQQRRIMKENRNSPLYLTGSRAVAAAIKELLPNTFSSTGGPNTMVTHTLTPAIAEAVRYSTTIENSGQCTAMRHLVAPGVGIKDVERVFEREAIDVVGKATESLAKGGFAGLVEGWGKTFRPAEGYHVHPSGLPIAYRVSEAFPYGIDEHWRRVYLDVTTPKSAADLNSPEFLDKFSLWMTTEQPISLAINTEEKDFELAQKLFKNTAQVVYSVGRDDKPCLTAQARPQDGEVFGEFPPRRDLTKYTKYPVIVPSPTPGYCTDYTHAFLEEEARKQVPSALACVFAGVTSPHVKGYMNVLQAYLKDACGPKRGIGARTSLWGWQRPPITARGTELRVSAATQRDEVALHILPFYMTNARGQLSVSCDPKNKQVAEFLKGIQGVTVVSETEESFSARIAKELPWNVIHPAPVTEFGLVSHFVSLLFPLGHIKSTKSNDEHFVKVFSASEKWLATAV